MHREVMSGIQRMNLDVQWTGLKSSRDWDVKHAFITSHVTKEIEIYISTMLENYDNTYPVFTHLAWNCKREKKGCATVSWTQGLD